MPYRTYTSKEIKKAGLKAAMLRGNADEGHKFKSYLVYTVILKILALKKIVYKARLSSQLSHIISKTWITTAVYHDWFKNGFVSEAEKYC